MWDTNQLRQTIIALAGLVVVTWANAEPGDAVAVSKARKDYARAMHGHDAGLQNAMRVELAYQLAQSRERTKRKAEHTAHPPTSNRAG